MGVTNPIKEFIKEFYVVSYNPKQKQIILHDQLDPLHNKNTYIDIGRVGRVKITLCWGIIEGFTGIQYHHKEFQSELSNLFFTIITEKKSKDLFKLLVEENIPVKLSMNEVIDEFPILND
jgi:hypothetical protein